MKLQVFYDFTCPYCYEGLRYLRSQLKEHPDCEPVWFPCEAHPRPETYGMHSDIAILGFYFAAENGVDAWDYNDAMFKAVFEDRKNIEDINEVAKVISGLGFDGEQFKEAVKSGKYSDMPDKNNRLAWGENALQAVPGYKLGGEVLSSKNGIAVTEKQLSAFLGRR